ncbi:MAG: DinB family protein [Acidobacteriota bacterium]
MRRPDPSEYAEYYGLYVNQVPEGDIFELLTTGVEQTVRTLGNLPADWESFAYETGKWTLREIVGHLLDVERVFSYRAVSIARRDPAALPGMDQDFWAKSSKASARPLADQLAELEIVRSGTRALFESFDDAMWDQRGVASDCEFSVRAFPYIIVGHEVHHLKVAEERYLGPLRSRA